MKNFLKELSSQFQGFSNHFLKPDERIQFVNRIGDDFIVKVAGVEIVIEEQTYFDALRTFKILDDYLENARTSGQKVVELVAENDSFEFFVIIKGERYQISFPIDGKTVCERCSRTHFVTGYGLRPAPFLVESNCCLSCHREESRAMEAGGVEDREAKTASGTTHHKMEDSDEPSLADFVRSFNELATDETPHVDTPKIPPVTTHQEREDSDESSLADFARSLQQGVSEPQASPLGQSDDTPQQKKEVFGRVGRELVRKYRDLIFSQRTYTLKRGKILDRWSTVILNGQGHEDKIIALTVQLLEESEVADMDWQMVSLQPTRIKGFMLSKKRDYLMVKSRGAGERHRMYIGARDYGNHLDVTWFLVERTPFWKTLAKFIAIVYTLGGAITLLHFDILMSKTSVPMSQSHTRVFRVL